MRGAIIFLLHDLLAVAMAADIGRTRARYMNMMFTRLAVAVSILSATPLAAKQWVPASHKGDDCIVGGLFVTEGDTVSLDDFVCTIEARARLKSGNQTILTAKVMCETDWPSVERMTFAMIFEGEDFERMQLQWNKSPPQPYRLCGE